MMRIAIVTSFPRNPETPHGGVEAVSVNLVKALATDAGTEVHVLTTNLGGTAVETLNWENATIHYLPAVRKSLLAYAVGPGRREIQAYLRRLQPGVVHAHDTYGIMLKGWPGPRVFTIHGFIHEDTRYGQGRMAWARSLLWKWVETAAWHEQPHIISISPYVRERLRGIVRGVIHDIENPISNACFAVQSNLAHPVIFSAAVVSARKNTLSLLQAFGRLAKTNTDVRLRLAGKATERAYGDAVKQWINANTMSERVTMLGSVTAAQVRAELAGASVFALVSLEEGAPMGVAEAMAAGVPVVTSNRCGMPYMVRDGETGFLVDPLNSENIARRLEILMSQPALRKQLGSQAHEFALNHFHPSIVARRTLAVYREAIEGNHSSARI